MIGHKHNRIRKGSSSRDPEARSGRSDVTESALRQTGLPLQNAMPWGSHLCLFYETKDDLLDTLAAYFCAGFENHEFGVWAVSEPITEAEAANYLRRTIPDFNARLSAGQIEILPGHEWYLKGNQFDLKRITRGWNEKLSGALAKGYDGMRVSGNAFWIGTDHWKEFCEYEQELDRALAGQKMIVLCTYPSQASRAVDILDVTRAHQFSMARRKGRWEFLETPELKQANREIRKLNGALDILSKPFSHGRSLTPRERVVLAQVIRGASSKEVARTLHISPRTIAFHRANIMRKLRAKNTVDLLRKVFAE